MFALLNFITQNGCGPALICPDMLEIVCTTLLHRFVYELSLWMGFVFPLSCLVCPLMPIHFHQSLTTRSVWWASLDHTTSAMIKQWSIFKFYLIGHPAASLTCCRTLRISGQCAKPERTYLCVSACTWFAPLFEITKRPLPKNKTCRVADIVYLFSSAEET